PEAPGPAPALPAGTTSASAPASEAPAPHGIRTWWSQIDLRGSFVVIRAIPGLLALILFACFNNFIGGVFMALMDPYGLELMSPQAWGIVLGVTSTGFILGGVIISRTGLGTNPVRTLLLANVVVALIGMLFAVREHWWLFSAGIFLFMMVVPAAEATEQTILQRVVPYHRQGRVFGVAQSVETAASPVSAFFIAIIAQSIVIPWMDDGGGQAALGWLVGDGRARGMAVLFMAAGVIMLLIVLVAFASRPYRALSQHYADTRQSIPAPGAEASAQTDRAGTSAPATDPPDGPSPVHPA
ncbi:MFS transporter, partial [uncultured Brevibacterium sp.]|uniref:MFS transporter n=1 Tax=uncultured Brevibacterium sp. TaxID=189678 RepID=UPI003457D95D